MKINAVSNFYGSKQQTKSSNVEFKACQGIDHHAISNFSIKELQILKKYINELKNTEYCDFKIIQHPDLIGSDWKQPVVSLRFLPNAEIYKYAGKKYHCTGAYTCAYVPYGETKCQGTSWIDNPDYDPSELRIHACKSKSHDEYHFKKDFNTNFDTIYREVQSDRSVDRIPFATKYHTDLFDGLVLVEAIEKYNNSLKSGKKLIEEILSSIKND